MSANCPQIWCKTYIKTITIWIFIKLWFKWQNLLSSNWCLDLQIKNCTEPTAQQGQLELHLAARFDVISCIKFIAYLSSKVDSRFRLTQVCLLSEWFWQNCLFYNTILLPVPENGRKPLYNALSVSEELAWISCVCCLRDLYLLSYTFVVFLVLVCVLQYCLIISPLCDFSSSSAFCNSMLTLVGYRLYYINKNILTKSISKYIRVHIKRARESACRKIKYTHQIFIFNIWGSITDLSLHVNLWNWKVKNLL